MKKVYYFLFAALSLASCSNEDAFETTDNNSTDVASILSTSETRSYDEALAIAKNAISMLEDSTNTTRSGEPSRTLDLANGVKTYRKNVTRTDGSVSNDPLLYVFNFNDNKGFAVVSANRATEALLAVVENGSYDPNSKWNDSFAHECLENLKTYVAEAKPEANVTRSGERQEPGSYFNDFDYYTYIGPYVVAEGDGYRFMRDVKNIHTIAPRIKVEWGQRGDIASWCPNKIAGSGPIALAQIMSFHKWPRHINLTFYDNRDNYQNWELMETYKNSSYQIPESFVQFPAFIREIGQRTGATYMADKTVTDISNLRSFMKSQQYAVSEVCTLNTAIFNDVITMIKKLTNMSFLVVQANSTTNRSNYHTFVIDGCNYYQVHEYLEGRQVERGSMRYDETCYYMLNHINWGEGGLYNGYYTFVALSPTATNHEKTHWNITGDNNNSNSGYFEGEKSPSYNLVTLKYFSTGR